MRLRESEIKAIKETCAEIFGEDAKVYLFGSRTDDTLKGGDIDLFIETTTDKSLKRKIRFKSILKVKIGDQKIDVVFAEKPDRLIEKEARKNMIRL